ncbi:toll/interleukin-1 receptor domain-containing protein [Thiothrix nivea]|nr:toll/interleukin-1 receptor domain-containing protein [Thiothrix nivea]
MHDVFISYSRTDKPWVQKLATALETAGYSVWWDADLLPGQSFEDAIKSHLDNAHRIVTVWSEASINSLWVREESSQALQRKALVPVMYQPVELPMPFGRIHTADLQGWEGDASDPRFRQLLQAITQTTLSPATKAEQLTVRKRLFDKLSRHWKSLSAAALFMVAIAGAYNDIKGVIVDMLSLSQPPEITLALKSDGHIKPGEYFTLLYTAPAEGYLSLWNIDYTSGTVEMKLPVRGVGTIHLNAATASQPVKIPATPGSNGVDKYILLWTPEGKPEHLPHRRYGSNMEFWAAVEALRTRSHALTTEVDVPIFP